MKLRANLLFIIILFCGFITTNQLLAKTEITSNSYRTDFEDVEEHGQWELNRGPLGSQCANKWSFGQPGANNGLYGLFASSSASTANYVNKGVSVVALRTLTLDAGEYELSFDWRAGGLNDADGLYVCWISESEGVKINSGTTNILQEFVLKHGVEIAPDEAPDSIRLFQRNWGVQTMKIGSDGSPSHLVFVWNNGASGPKQPGAAIDNLSILPVGTCPPPSNFNVNAKGHDFVLSWKGNADSYDLKIYCHMKNEWYYHNGLTAKSFIVEGMEEGMKTFYIRSNCDTVSGSWISKSSFFFYPNTRCINYMGLSDNNCFFGFFDNPATGRGAVDYGYQSKFSRHTLHYDPLEYDANTGGKLKTVPEGELASVRLGNWNVNREAESVVYDYVVDTIDGALLLLNYAVVMEDPNHDVTAQPKFTLDILDGNQPLEYGCGSAFFASGHGMDDTWHTFTTGGGQNGFWKEWTTVGINLAAYHGKSLKIKLATYDCDASGHFGYAYFTLGCSSGKIQGLSCGDSPENGFKGPDGFKYRWYLPDNPEKILSTDQVYTVPSSDTLTYYLDVIQPTNENCYFTLQASAVARWPHASGSYSAKIENCQNVVKFNNSSYILRENQITNITEKTNEPCESFLWDFGDGNTSTDENPTHIYAQGGTYTVTLSAGIANGACMSDTTFTITMPMLGMFADTTHAVVCHGQPYEFKGEYIYTTGIYADTVKTAYGCDSIAVLDLYVAPKHDSTLVDTICSHEEYFFNGERITKTGKYKQQLKSVYGCDSVTTLDIIVNESLILQFDTIVSACGDDSHLIMPYERKSGLLDKCLAEIDLAGEKYSVDADITTQPGAIMFPLPKDIKPGYYSVNLSFGEKACGGESRDIPLNIYYPRDVVTQRWGDVLAVRNVDYNGGYDFVSFQWFKNGAPIEGATSSVYYESDDDGLDLNAEYSVLLTRASDNVSIMTCVAELFDYADSNENRIAIFSQQAGSVDVETSNNARLRVWSVQGTLLKEVMISEGHSVVDGLISNGVCVFEFIYEDGEREIRQVVVK